MSVSGAVATPGIASAIQTASWPQAIPPEGGYLEEVVEVSDLSAVQEEISRDTRLAEVYFHSLGSRDPVSGDPAGYSYQNAAVDFAGTDEKLLSWVKKIVFEIKDIGSEAGIYALFETNNRTGLVSVATWSDGRAELTVPLSAGEYVKGVRLRFTESYCLDSEIRMTFYGSFYEQFWRQEDDGSYDVTARFRADNYPYNEGEQISQGKSTYLTREAEPDPTAEFEPLVSFTTESLSYRNGIKIWKGDGTLIDIDDADVVRIDAAGVDSTKPGRYEVLYRVDSKTGETVFTRPVLIHGRPVIVAPQRQVYVGETFSVLEDVTAFYLHALEDGSLEARRIPVAAAGESQLKAEHAGWYRIPLTAAVTVSGVTARIQAETQIEAVERGPDDPGKVPEEPSGGDPENPGGNQGNISGGGHGNSPGGSHGNAPSGGPGADPKPNPGDAPKPNPGLPQETLPDKETEQNSQPPKSPAEPPESAANSAAGDAGVAGQGDGGSGSGSGSPENPEFNIENQLQATERVVSKIASYRLDYEITDIIKGGEDGSYQINMQTADGGSTTVEVLSPDHAGEHCYAHLWLMACGLLTAAITGWLRKKKKLSSVAGLCGMLLLTVIYTLGSCRQDIWYYLAVLAGLQIWNVFLRDKKRGEADE